MFSERLKDLRKERKISQLALSQELELGRSTITQYETGSRTPDYQTLLKIARYFSVSVDYLLGNSFNKPADILKTDISLPEIDDQEKEKVPPFSYLDPQDQYFRESTSSKTDLIYFQVPDDSMKNARILKGDWAVIRKCNEINEGEIVMVMVKDNQPMLKRIFRKNNLLILKTENLLFPTIEVDLKEVEIVGKVIEVRFKV